jgi:hypothetical protein
MHFAVLSGASHLSTRYVRLALALGCLTHYMLLKFADPGAMKWVGRKRTALFCLQARWFLRVWRDFVGFIADASGKHVDTFFSSDVSGVTKYLGHIGRPVPFISPTHCNTEDWCNMSLNVDSATHFHTIPARIHRVSMKAESRCVNA